MTGGFSSPLSSLPPSDDVPEDLDDENPNGYPSSPTPAPRIRHSLSPVPIDNVPRIRPVQAMPALSPMLLRLISQPPGQRNTSSAIALGLQTATTQSPSTPRRQRRSSLPSMSPSSAILSPFLPVEERLQKIRKEAAQKRFATQRAEARQLREQEQERVARLSEEVLGLMQEIDLSFGDFMEYTFNPESKLGELRWNQFFRDKNRVPKILNWWTSSTGNSNSGIAQVTEWSVGFVEGLVRAEAAAITKGGIVRRSKVDEDLISGFNIDSWYDRLRKECASVTTRIFDAAATSARQIKDGFSAGRILKKKMAVVSSIFACLAEHSTFNNLLKRILGLYLYATGAQRQLITVLSHLGITESFTQIVGGVSLGTVTTSAIDTNSSNPTKGSPSTRKTPGTLQQLSTLMRKKSRGLAELVTYGAVYDNVNFTERVGEQTLGRNTSVESATAATIWPLHKADKEDMKLQDLEDAFDKAGPLCDTDILHTRDEAIFFRKSLVHCILRVAVAHGGSGFKKFEAKLAETLPRTKDTIDVHKTELHPLPTWKIDESTIVGNADVINAITKELHLKNQSSSWMKYVRIVAGDQLSIARLRALANLRAGHEDCENSLRWGVWMPGLFHAKIADMHGFFVTHWGKANAGVQNPGCLAFHNTLLRNHPISITSLPAFRTCRDLVFVSLYARALHCLLQVSGHSTLEEYCEKVDSWDDFYKHGELIYDQYASTKAFYNLRRERGIVPKEKPSKAKKGNNNPPPALPKKGDIVLENAILFFRDALISREFTDAVKVGDSGRVVLVLKIWALSFRGNGRTKYAYEMLSILHNLQKVWPKAIASIVLNNWLLNPTGRPNSFVEVDLVQEHMNFWIKASLTTFYKARGSNSSWEWLEMVSPCIQALRHLCSVMKDNLGTDIGTRHTPANLSRDIAVLMDSLKMHNVYTFQEGRQLDPDDPPTVDIITTGQHSLKTPLEEYNESFKKLQSRRRMTPAVEMVKHAPNVSLTSASGQPTSTPTPNTPAQTSVAEVAGAGSVEVPLPAANPPGSGLKAVSTVEEESSDGEQEAERPVTELGLLCLDEEEPTLERVGLEDVEFDMDFVEQEIEDDVVEEELEGISVEDVFAD